MNRDDIIKMAREAGFTNPERLEIFGIKDENLRGILEDFWINLERFAALVAAHERKACIEIIETYRIPVGNSPSGELACEWTYRALHEIRDDIRARGEK